ncbi:hypothetical protein [Candidatus Xianfuyuplasma coldseepsis]|uniref:Uncharacterized protein n=1 Tax=Candidatus Xianfuyuplasma coldseepsis TaxID=2782163 RepID=A0A7L7KSG2_9MOLU|nr:hypothetical protein [Xianfuyuplasma coldseepsis]QMS84718.1 hypothetical protein G4Z02_02770 [Xianfuyuplasma coldseepsis]
MISDMLGKLVQDDMGKLRLVIEKKGHNYYVLSEKLVSLRMWFEIFYESFCSYDLEALRQLEINKETIELINYLSICNGILDVSIGLNMITEKIFKGYESIHFNEFKNMREHNEEHDIFFGISEYDSQKYFKHVRAVFGQHPSNLDYKRKDKPIRGFSSWTFNNNTGLTNDTSDIFTNIYYDLSEKGWGIKFHLFYDEIKEFTNNRINQIESQINHIIKEIDEFIEKNCVGKIEGLDSLSLIDRVSVLRKEMPKRFGYEDYHYIDSTLETLNTMLGFSSLKNFKIEEDSYVEGIRKCIDEIIPIIEKCSDDELPFNSNFSTKIYDAIGHNYWREKCAMYLNGDDRYFDMYSKVCNVIATMIGEHPSYTKGDFLYRLFLISLQEKVAIPKT